MGDSSFERGNPERLPTLTPLWRPGLKEAPPFPGFRAGSSRSDGEKGERRVELVPVVPATRS